MTLQWPPQSLFRDLEEVEAWNALMSYSGAHLPLGAKGATAIFAPAQGPDPEDCAAEVTATGGQSLIVVFRRFPFAAFGAPDLAPGDLALIPPALLHALHEGMLAFLCSMLPDAKGCALRGVAPWGDLAGEGDPGDRRWIRVEASGLTEEPLETLIGCRAGDLGGLLGSLGAGGRRVTGALMARIPAQAHVCAERLEITLDALRKIEPRDLVLFDAQAGHRLFLRAGARLFELAREDMESWRVLSVRGDRRAAQSFTSVESEIMTPERAENGQETLSEIISDVSEIPVTIDFDLGSVTRSLAEIESWREGSVIALETPAFEEGCRVILRVNGAVVGAGDLIRIDDRFAVRLSRWLGRS